MSPAETAGAVRRRLAGELQQDLDVLTRLRDDIASLMTREAETRAEWMRGLALALRLTLIARGCRTRCCPPPRHLTPSSRAGFE